MARDGTKTKELLRRRSGEQLQMLALRQWQQALHSTTLDEERTK
jgi:hypothetical protein